MIPNIAKLFTKYSNATQIVPATIARGIVFDAFSTDSAGVVADSRPINPHKVSKVTLLKSCEEGKRSYRCINMKIININVK